MTASSVALALIGPFEEPLLSSSRRTRQLMDYERSTMTACGFLPMAPGLLNEWSGQVTQSGGNLHRRNATES
jgi:hypothetical protein